MANENTTPEVESVMEDLRDIRKRIHALRIAAYNKAPEPGTPEAKYAEMDEWEFGQLGPKLPCGPR